MTDDIVTDLRAWGSNLFMLRAADEIERLRTERDDARFRYCLQRWIASEPYGLSLMQYAKEQGWGYLANHHMMSELNERSAPE